jgi:hypothetical protein
MPVFFLIKFFYFSVLQGTDESNLKHRLRNRDNLKFIQIQPDQVNATIFKTLRYQMLKNCVAFVHQTRPCSFCISTTVQCVLQI